MDSKRGSGRTDATVHSGYSPSSRPSGPGGLEGAGLPAREAPPFEDVAQPPSYKPLEAQVMMRLHELIPATTLLGLDPAHGHLGEGKFRRGNREKGGAGSMEPDLCRWKKPAIGGK